MARKYKKVQHSKPPGSAHPALSSSSSSSNDGSNTSAPSVNDLIQQSRRSQVPSSAGRVGDDANAPTVHPSLRAILQIPDTPPPMPRPVTHLIGARRPRGPAGPPPPISWLTDSIHAPEHLRVVKRPGNGLGYIGSNRPDRLPGIFLPEKSSLFHLILKNLAKNWEWHVEHDKYYLAALPGRYKETLLSYIATYNSNGVTLNGLETMFLDETELEGATGSDIKRLDLGGAISSALTFRDLNTYLTKKSSQSDLATTSNTVPDSWDSLPATSPAILPSPHRFSLLTHISFASPASPSWRALLDLTPHLHLLTHLSLAYWPTPFLTPNSSTATTVSPQGQVLPYGGSNIYSHTLDGDWNEAVSILRRLGKGTPCLKWLDLEGCSSWLEALAWNRNHLEESIHSIEYAPPSPESQDAFPTSFGIPWLSHWRSLTTIRTAQPSLPPCLLTSTGNWDNLLKSSTIRALGTKDANEEAYCIQCAERRELVAWLREERKIEKVIKSVKEITRRRGGKGAEMRFERGWEGEWVGRAMEQDARDEARRFWGNVGA